MGRIDEELAYENKIIEKDQEIAELKARLAAMFPTVDEIGSVIVNWNGFAEYELANAIHRLMVHGGIVQEVKK